MTAASTIPKRVYTELKVAAVLGVHRISMSRWRKAGKIRPDIFVNFTDQERLDRGIPSKRFVMYDADLVDAIARGDARLDEAGADGGV